MIGDLLEAENKKRLDKISILQRTRSRISKRRKLHFKRNACKLRMLFCSLWGTTDMARRISNQQRCCNISKCDLRTPSCGIYLCWGNTAQFEKIVIRDSPPRPPPELPQVRLPGLRSLNWSFPRSQKEDPIGPIVSHFCSHGVWVGAFESTGLQDQVTWLTKIMRRFHELAASG